MIFGERRHAAAVYTDDDCRAVGLRKVRRMGFNVNAEGKLPCFPEKKYPRENGWKAHRHKRWRDHR